MTDTLKYSDEQLTILKNITENINRFWELIKLQEKPMQNTLKYELNENIVLGKSCPQVGTKGKILSISNDVYNLITDSGEQAHHVSCLEKLQDKPMENTQDIKVGDEVRVLPDAKEKTIEAFGSNYWSADKDETINTIMKVNEVCNDYVCTDSLFNWIYPFSAVEKITQESEQVKLEVGQEYDIPSRSRNPYIYLGNTNQYGFNNPFPLIFINSQGVVVSIREIEISSIKKHSEPFKHTIEGWIGFEDRYPGVSNNTNDLLLNKYSSNHIHTNKEYVDKQWKEKIHVRITVEEITESK